MLSLHRFYFDAITFARPNRYRYGQVMFNYLELVRPDLAEQVRATDMDPFYCESPKDPQFDRFIQFIETNWYSTPNG